MDYMIILGFVLVESMLLYKYYKKKSMFFLVAFTILILIFCAGRPIISNVKNCDAIHYSRFYHRAFHKSFSVYMKEMGGFEYLFYGFFWVCAKMNFTYLMVRILYYLIMTGFLIVFIRNSDLEGSRYSDYWIIVTNYVLSFCLMRNSLAYVIGWIAISHCLKRRYLKGIIYAFLGVMVHSSCVIMFAFILFFAAINLIRKFYLMLSLVICSYALVIYLFPMMLAYLGQTNDKIAYYLDISTSGSFALLTNLIRFLLLIILLVEYQCKRRFVNDLQYKNITLLILFSYVVIFAQLINGIVYRFLPYFNVINMIAFSYLRQNESDSYAIKIGNVKTKHIFVILANIITLVMFLQRDLYGYGLIPIY